MYKYQGQFFGPIFRLYKHYWMRTCEKPMKNLWNIISQRNTLWKNLWILQGLNFVKKSQNLEPVKKPVNFKTCEKTYEKTYDQNREKIHF